MSFRSLNNATFALGVDADTLSISGITNNTLGPMIYRRFTHYEDVGECHFFFVTVV